MSESYIESYPPMFRSSINNSPTQKVTQKDGQVGGAGASDPLPLPLPVIDMESVDYAEKLDKACREWGILRLENHGVPRSLIFQLQEHAKRVFELPFEAKQGLIGSNNDNDDGENKCPIKYFWGTPALNSSGLAIPRASHAPNIDWLEGLHVPLSQLLHHQHHHHHHPLIHEFRKLLEEYSRHVTRIALVIFEAMVKSLKLDLQVVKQCLDETTGLIRVYRYPHHSIEEHVQGLHEHTDSSVLTILNEDQVGGLQFFKDNQWFKVMPNPSTLLVNLGDMMQAMSDDEYKSVKHKVELNKDKERVSICYFVFPEDNALIQSSHYKPFTYLDFRAQVHQDLISHGRKIGLINFKL